VDERCNRVSEEGAWVLCEVALDGADQRLMRAN